MIKNEKIMVGLIMNNNNDENNNNNIDNNNNVRVILKSMIVYHDFNHFM